MENRTQISPLLTGVLAVIAAVTGAAMATEGGFSELVSAVTAPQNATVRATTGPQRGDYGPDPAESSFGIHAVVMRHYMQGAYFPIGGADAIAGGLVPVIELRAQHGTYAYI